MSPRLPGTELLQPMLASPGKSVPGGDDWVFEPKYDGIRIVALATTAGVALMTRNGHDKCRQFPEVTEALRALVKSLERNLVLDGEIVALGEDGEPGRFQNLQGRMHLTNDEMVSRLSSETPIAFVVFDILVDGSELLLDEPWHARRKTLEHVLRAAPASVKRLIRPSAVTEGSADGLLRDARDRAWEGIMAKRRDGRYEPGRRVRHWQKVKLENQQEFVVGGWTEPRSTRQHFGALLLGYYDDDGQLVYAGHSGGGFSDRLLSEIGRKLKKIERPDSPFSTTPRTNERAHWAEPKYVAEVKFNEWTAGGNLRQPIFLGLRDDKDPRSIVRENGVMAKGARAKGARAKGATAKGATARRAKRPRAQSSKHTALIEQLRDNANAESATIQIDAKTRLSFTSFGKVFFPIPQITKGRLLEYYVDVAPYLLPALDDRPLVLKRYPNGISGEAFYQQKAPDKVPPGVRVEEVADEGIETERRLIGGTLATLLYIVQLGAISTDPWHSRVQSVAEPDYSIVDLDPGPKATFKRVIQVARWVKEELDELGLHGVPKTSGASGIHVALPLPPGASYEISRVLAQLVARRVNEKHPKQTTVVRAVKARPPAAVYVDYLQNIRGKTVASVYSARAEPHASVSTPLKWTEITNDLDPRDFTVETLPKRLKRVGDLWAAGMRRRNRLPGIIGDAAA